MGCNKTDGGSKGGNVGIEEFAGAISEKTYDSVENAVKGFLAKEISGKAFKAEYVNYVKSATLSKDEINGLVIKEDLKSGIVGAEKFEVEYIQKPTGKVEGIEEKTCKRYVFVVAYSQNGNNKYRFYTPLEESGQTLSLSSFNALFYGERFYNCTIKMEGIDYIGEYEDPRMCDYLVKSTETAFSIIEESLNFEYYQFKYNGDEFFTDDETGTLEVIKGEWDEEITEEMKELSFRESGIEAQLVGSFWDYEGYFRFDLGGDYYGIEHIYRSVIYNYHDCFIKTQDSYEQMTKIIVKGDYNEAEYTLKFDKNVVSEYKVVDDDGEYTRYTFSNYGTTKIEIPKKIMDMAKSL